MYFEINVSLNGQHYFATAKRSLTNEIAARALYTVLCAKFPEPDGYRVSLTQWKESGVRLADTNIG